MNSNILAILLVACVAPLVSCYAGLPSELPLNYRGCTSNQFDTLIGEVYFNESAHEQCSSYCDSALIGLVSASKYSSELFCVCYNATPEAVNDELCVVPGESRCAAGSGASLCGSYVRGSSPYIALYENVIPAHERSERGITRPNNPYHKSGPNNANNYNGVFHTRGKTGIFNKKEKTGKTGINNYPEHKAPVHHTSMAHTTPLPTTPLPTTPLSTTPAPTTPQPTCQCTQDSDCNSNTLECNPACQCVANCITMDAPILMANGSIVRAEDVHLGDQVVGVDGVNVVTYIKIGTSDTPVVLYGLNGRKEYFTLEHPMYNPARSGPYVMDLEVVHSMFDAFHIPRDAIPVHQINVGHTSLVAYDGSHFNTELVVSTTRSSTRSRESVYFFQTIPRDRVDEDGSYIVDGLVNDGNAGKMSFVARTLIGPFITHAFETFTERLNTYTRMNPGSSTMSFLGHVSQSLGASVPGTIQLALENHSNGKTSSDNVAAWKQFYSGVHLSKLQTVHCDTAAKELFHAAIYMSLSQLYAGLDNYAFSTPLYNDLLKNLIQNYDTTA